MECECVGCNKEEVVVGMKNCEISLNLKIMWFLGFILFYDGCVC